MKNLTQEKEFGPYSKPPQVHMDYSKGQSLIRTVFEEETETFESEENKRTFGQKIWDYLFKDNTPKLKKIKERKILEKETLAERVNGFTITEKEGKYYINAKLF